jgi:2,4-dienoyl-CoA reductase (NADPH2)
VLASLGHAGGQGTSSFSQDALWAPSAVPEPNSRELPKTMEAEDVAAVVASFGAAAALAAAAGLDGVEVNAGQHSLVRQFLSGLTNQRSDEYGADRRLFAREVLEAVRRELGDGVLGLRLSIDELAPWAGITPDSAVPLVQELAPLVDYLVLVRGSIYSVAATRPDCHVEPGFNLPATAQVRAALAEPVPVFAQGSIVDPAMAEQALQDGICDGVEMTRTQIADAELVRKLADGRSIRPCILCNQACQVLDMRNPVVSCVADPASGHELDDPPLDATVAEPQEVLVVGGGPAGLEAARVAALRGHHVRLVEQRDRLGGMVRIAAAAPGRERLAGLVDWLEAECRRLGVEIVTGTRQTAGHHGPTILCTGSRDGEATYAAETEVVSAASLLETAPPEGPVVVWDPVGGPIGVSVAELLARRGPTTLVTQDQVVGHQLALSGDLVAANQRLRAAGVELVRRAVLRRVTAEGALVEDLFGAGTHVLPAALVVDAGHRLPDPGPDLPDAVRAGDAVSPRTILEAILEGRRAVLSLDRTRELELV